MEVHLTIQVGCRNPHSLRNQEIRIKRGVDRAIKACASRWASLVRSGVKGPYCNTVMSWEFLVSVSFRLGTQEHKRKTSRV